LKIVGIHILKVRTLYILMVC